MTDVFPVEVAKPGPSNSIRSDHHPILESGNLSFPKGRYVLEFNLSEDRNSCELRHLVEQAPLITRLVAEGKAHFACVVSSPVSSYRKTHLSSREWQKVTWRDDDLGEPPLFTPMVLCMEPLALTLDADSDGLHRIWDGHSVSLHKGTRLALGSVIQFEASIIHLLTLQEDPNLEDGQFFVETKSEPFQFVVKLGRDLHGFLRHDRSVHRGNIMTHVVTACLAHLQCSEHFKHDDDETGWKSHRNLVAFADYLGNRELGHWADEDFQPERVATALHPLNLPEQNVGRGDESDEA